MGGIYIYNYILTTLIININVKYYSILSNKVNIDGPDIKDYIPGLFIGDN